MPLDSPSPPLVSPEDFATAVVEALAKVLSMPLDRDVVASTVEEVRQVAKEARSVVEEAYPADELDAFTQRLTPIFERARSS
jgi:hypothetical protein